MHLLNRLERNQWVKVLVVEDTCGIRENLKMLLGLHRYQVVTAEDGEQALHVLEEHPDVRVVITDFNMPHMDGLELVGRLREDNRRDRIAIIGMSAKGAGTLSAKFLKSGANNFLPKPFLHAEFHCLVSQNVELLELIEKIQKASYRDFLTNLFNHRYFFAASQEMHRQAVEGRLELTTGMIDIDHFKRVNDQHGHAASDQALRQVALTQGHLFLGPALVARLWGEEFCVLVSGLDRQQGTLLRFNQARKAIGSTPVASGRADLQPDRLHRPGHQPGALPGRHAKADRRPVLPGQRQRPQPRGDGGTEKSLAAGAGPGQETIVVQALVLQHLESPGVVA